MSEIVIDGAQGEGGGQVLRTALSLSMVTGRPFRMFDVRARRRRPGLRPQHLTALLAAQKVSSASVEGAAPGSMEVRFSPGKLRPGAHAFDIGTAGSTTLIAQTLVPPLISAASPSTISLQGGTHNPMSPPFEFLKHAYLPLLNRMGADVDASLARPGFFPAGGGRIELTIGAAGPLAAIELATRGALLERKAHAIVSHLPLSIAERELAVIGEALSWPEHELRAEDDKRARGPGNVLMLVLVFEHLTTVFTGFGQRGLPAEKVAARVVKQVNEFLAGEAAVDRYLADQLLIPFAMAGGGRFTTGRPSEHTKTNSGIIEMFLPVRIEVRKTGRDSWEVSVRS